MNAPAAEAQIGALLKEKGLTLAVAESCTGGLLGHRITESPGCSAYFVGGVIAYSYDAKERLLHVRHDTLYNFGAVSAEVALEMAHGVRRVFSADIGLSVTGIAGPGGGLPDKPVGLVYIGFSARSYEHWVQHVWRGDRSGNKVRSVDAALQMLLDFLSQ